jgi:hypothetical protein
MGAFAVPRPGRPDIKGAHSLRRGAPSLAHTHAVCSFCVCPNKTAEVRSSYTSFLPCTSWAVVPPASLTTILRKELARRPLSRSSLLLPGPAHHTPPGLAACAVTAVSCLAPSCSSPVPSFGCPGRFHCHLHNTQPKVVADLRLHSTLPSSKGPARLQLSISSRLARRLFRQTLPSHPVSRLALKSPLLPCINFGPSPSIARRPRSYRLDLHSTHTHTRTHNTERRHR